MNTVIPSPDQAIEKLKQDWNLLSDLERARALAEIKKSGLSNRKIAIRLPCSESSIRRLLLILLAPATDLAAARNENLSTNEILRRAKAEAARKSARRDKDLQREREEQILKGTKLVCDWLIGEHVSGPDGEQIIEDVRRELAMRELDGSLPKLPEHIDLKIVEIINRSRPKRPRDDNAAYNSWYAEWLFWWAFNAFPNSDVRDEALELALQKQWKR